MPVRSWCLARQHQISHAKSVVAGSAPGCRGQSRRGKATSCHQRHRQHSPDRVPIFCRQTQAPIRDTMFAARRLSLVRPVAGRRLFHATAPAFVKVGDKIPNVELMENSPGNKINIAQELKSGKGLIIGEPFTPLHHSRRVSLQLRLIYYHLQVFLPPTRPLARRTIFPDISTLLNSKMPARSLLFPSTTALCKWTRATAGSVCLDSPLPRLLRLSRVEDRPLP